MSQLNQAKTYKINQILHDSICKNGLHNVILKLNGHLVTFGFVHTKPYEGDIIECDLIPRDDHETYKFTKYKMYLPLGESAQIQRINKLLQDNNLKYNYNEINTFFSTFFYGKNFWINLFKTFLKTKLDDYDEINKNYLNYITIVGEHISIYFNSLIGHFKEELNKLNIKLNHKQYTDLYLHPNFGFDIESWSIKDLYVLLDVEGFGIKTIIQLAIGFEVSKKTIIEFVIIYCLKNCSNGSVCIQDDFDVMIMEIKNQKNLEGEIDLIEKILTKNLYDKIINKMILKNKIIKVSNYLYDFSLFNSEMSIAFGLHKINNNLIKLIDDPGKINKFITEYQVKPGLYLNKEQVTGITNVFSNNVSIIYGKAGTGKSSLLAGLLSTINWINKNIGVYFLTPTAKAKMKLYEDILKDWDEYKENIRTINSFIYTNDISSYKDTNLFVIDETSMVDIKLMSQTIEILTKVPNPVILFLGDIRQLPSIGPGDFLNNIINSNCYSSTELTQVVRNGGIITKILDKIIDGNTINPKDIESDNEFKWIIPTDKDYSKYINENIKPDTMIIAATNRLINDLTDKIRDIKYPDNKTYNEYTFMDKDYNKITLKVGDPVIHGQNFNQDGLFNGMTGEIVEIVKSYNVTKSSNITKIKVLFDNKYKIFDSDSEFIKHLRPAYMITVHKSQGQEYPHIIIVLADSQLLNRNTLYTAISRAKKSVTLISTEKILNKAIERKNTRISLLENMFKYINTYVFNDSDNLESVCKNFISKFN